jgi:hypothetical protein
MNMTNIMNVMIILQKHMTKCLSELILEYKGNILNDILHILYFKLFFELPQLYYSIKNGRGITVTNLSIKQKIEIIIIPNDLFNIHIKRDLNLCNKKCKKCVKCIVTDLSTQYDVDTFCIIIKLCSFCNFTNFLRKNDYGDSISNISFNDEDRNIPILSIFPEYLHKLFDVSVHNNDEINIIIRSSSKEFLDEELSDEEL